MKATVFAHSSKESNYEIGKKLGLKGEALNVFAFACIEVELTVDVDPNTGLADISHIDGRKVAEAL